MEFQSRQKHVVIRLCDGMRFLPFCNFCEARNELISRSAASSYDIDESFVDEFSYLRSHRIGCLIIKAEFVGQSRIGVNADIIRCFLT